MGATASVCPAGVEDRVYEKLHEAFEDEKNAFESQKGKKQKQKQKLSCTLPSSLEECLALPTPNAEEQNLAAEIYHKLENKYEEVVNQYTVPSNEVPLKALPEAVEESVYVHERWPLLLDVSGQGYRFLKYQNGQFIIARSPIDIQPENLRKSLVSCIKHGTMLVINFEEQEVDLEPLFDQDHFPKEVLKKGDLFKEETLKRILRTEAGDEEVDHFMPKDEFRFVVVTTLQENVNLVAGEYNMAVINVMDPNQKGNKDKQQNGASDLGGLAIAEAFGAKEVKRNSTKLVEAAFEGDWEAVKDQIEKGYSFESEDPHQHTALSEAACQSHLDIVQQLLDMGADPNTQNDAGRTPLYRASYNGHAECISLLLKHGADPRLCSGIEAPVDVAKTEECTEIFEAWDEEETDRLVALRKAEMEKKIEERLTTAAERDSHAREKIRQELVQLTLEGTAEELKGRLDELANEAVHNNERPRGKAEVRDEKGNTLLLLAVWKNKLDTVKMLTSHWKTLDEEWDKVERKVFYCNINARDSKGWNACALATFHGHKTVLQYLLDNGADPYVYNSYRKNSFDFAKDDLDACRNVVTDRSEIRAILESWEMAQHPQEAAKRKKQEEEFAKLEAEQKQKQKAPSSSTASKSKTASAKGNKKRKKKGKPK